MATKIRTKPKAFSRPSIDLTQVDKGWREVRVSSLSAGDYVKGYSGPLQEVITLPSGDLILSFIKDQSDAFSPDTVVEAYTNAKE